ncbi:sterol desaturase family protein [Hyalangium sp.]|uniref:sterol desaturase family protein n=1 Tax=Hyalangium sp. TaxID=2028555 RepID=UPI002D5BCDBE|nr:sterol desaturase family protein [Hyalangium sp.]HYH95705.1 sterol desaturase family protein [Hyalangium sp.]
MDTAHIPDLITPAIPFFVLSLIIEGFVVKRLKDEGRDVAGHTVKDTTASLSMGLGNLVIGLVWKGIAFAFYVALYELTPLRMGTGALAWVLIFFGDDLCYYWFHRVHHECRFFWAGHVVHHSSQHYNLSTALRQPWTTPITGAPFWAPLALLGFHPAMIVAMQSISLLYQYWIHTEAIGKLGPLEWVLNTPSHHRVHHASNPQYLDRNHGGILIIWDRLFGTFEPEQERPLYGLTTNIRTFNPLRIVAHEFAAILRDLRRPEPLRLRLARVFRNPAWKPPGESASASGGKASPSSTLPA